MKKILFLFILSLCAVYAFSQKNNLKIVFNEENHDFGTITDNKGEAKTIFTFLNLSQSPVWVKSVDVSCGCTTPRYTQKPILPGKSGNIEVAFNPAGRPGHFYKSITVKIGTDKEMTNRTLYIQGDVANSSNKFIDEIGEMALSRKTIELGSTTKDNTIEKIFEVKNTTSKEMKIQFSAIPSTIELPEGLLYTLAAQETLPISILYNPEFESTFGDFTYKLPVKVNGKNSGEILLKTTVKQDFTTMSQSVFSENAPKIHLTPRFTNLTTLKQGQKRTTKVRITNRGKSPMNIYSFTAPVNYVIIEKISPSTQIASGGSIDVEIKVDTKDIKYGRYTVPCKIVSNDPWQPISDLVIEFSVIQ